MKFQIWGKIGFWRSTPTWPSQPDPLRDPPPLRPLRLRSYETPMTRIGTLLVKTASILKLEKMEVQDIQTPPLRRPSPLRPLRLWSRYLSI